MQNSSIKNMVSLIRRMPVQFPALSMITRQASLDRFSYISGYKEAVVFENESWDDFCYGSSLVMILIAGKDFKIFFKAHFHSKKFRKSLAPEKTELSIADLFREYCNLSAGAIKQSLQDAGLVSGISLPSITSGYDELVFSDKIRSDRIIDCFDIGGPNFRFTVTATLDTSSPEVRSKVEGLEFKALEEEEIDFL